jgi:hypothetical protein
MDYRRISTVATGDIGLGFRLPPPLGHMSSLLLSLGKSTPSLRTASPSFSVKINELSFHPPQERIRSGLTTFSWFQEV